MNETPASATNAKIAKRMTDTFGLPKYEMPKMEIPAEFREITDKGVAHARDACAKARVASEEAADLFKNTYATAANAATDYNLKLIEIFRTNTRAAFDHVHELLGVKSPSEFIELSTAHLRKQYDIVSAQNKDLYALSQKVATEGRRAN
ncbi:MAG: phasin family protein [Xanthobacteraceae bacterium]